MIPAPSRLCHPSPLNLPAEVPVIVGQRHAVPVQIPDPRTRDQHKMLVLSHQASEWFATRQ